MRFTFVKPILLLALLFFVMGGYAQNPCPNTVPTNLVTNGDFSAGNTGFTVPQSYAGGSPPSVQPGDYTVWTNPNVTNSYYATIGDHTTGTGNMLIVDVAGTVGEAVYQTTVNVTAGNTYFFSAWFANINQTYASAPILKFSITAPVGGTTTLIGNTAYVDSTDNKWKEFFSVYKATTSGAITLEIQNYRSGSAGNDLALDDISFAGSCANLSNLSAFGSNASVPDINECDFAFPYTIYSGLPNSGNGYTFQWKNSTLTPLTGTSTNNSYMFTTAPTPGKYYLCYDTLGCWKADSFMVNKALVFSIAPNQNLCPPIDYTITPTPTPTATNLTYSWELGGFPIPGANSSTYQATQDGTYTLTVTSTTPGCGPATAQMTITSPTSPLAGTVTCSSGNYQFSATSGTYNVIGANSNVAWYNSPTSTTAFTSSPDNVSATVPSTSLVTAPGCGEGGLYAQDLNSYYSVLGPATPPCPTNSSNQQQNGNSGQMQLTVTSTTTLTSLDIVQKNYSVGGNAYYQVQIWPDNAGSINTTGLALFTGTAVTPLKTTTATVITLPVGYTLTAGTKYWIQLSSTSSEYLYSDCGVFPYNNSPNPGIAQITKGILNSGAGWLPAFNLQLTEGSPNPCSRTWVCASASCPTPVKFMYILAQNQGAENTISWATAMELNNRYFVVERSTDAINFISLDTVAGAGNSSVIRDYSYIDNYAYDGIVYYRIKQVDMNGDYMYSDIAEVSSQSSGLVRFYPIPVKDGQSLNIDFKSSIAGTATIVITDMVGRQQLQVLKSAGKGGNTISVSTASLEQGTYIIELYTPDGNKTIERIVVN